MYRGYVAILGCICAAMFLSVDLFGQVAQRTPWGDPDLQGSYTNKTITPLERPENLADKPFLTEEEVAARGVSRVIRYSISASSERLRNLSQSCGFSIRYSPGPSSG